MSDALVFRQYAEEAMREASNAKNDDERKALENLACTWAQTALISEEGVAPNFIQHCAPKQRGEQRNRNAKGWVPFVGILFCDFGGKDGRGRKKSSRGC